MRYLRWCTTGVLAVGLSFASGAARAAQPSPATTGFYSVPGWYCLMFSSGLSCEQVTRGWEADLSPSGSVSICTSGTAGCHTGANTGGLRIPTIKVGQRVTVQPFRCTYAANGLTCVVIKSGVGFVLTASGATAVGSASSRSYARFYTPSRNITCEMSDDGTSQAAVGCIMQQPPAIASLAASGVATICQHQGLRCTGNLGDSPSLPRVRQLSYGSADTVGRFRCTSGSTGVTCVVSATRKGFFISRQSVRPVG